ncbi:hypothetical protein MCEKH37_00330 [Methylophilaceae bacterium]
MNKILAALLFVAVLPLPYAYYEILRVAVCLGALYMLVKEWPLLEGQTKGALIVIAVLFNPFSPIYLSKIIWVVIDIITGVYLIQLKIDKK